jgi:murein DD-endopeptidase MepM/ murein hydrolase activator NlpD
VSLRDLFDFDDLLTSADEIWSQAMRSIFQYDAYAGKNQFPAIVLSAPVPYNTAQAGLFTGVPKPDTPSSKSEDEQSGKDGALNKIGIIAFRARIIGANSPHSFLPDPCTDEISADLPADSVFKLVSMHTLFMSTDDYSATTKDLPTKGSVVLVELEQNQFGYNLEIGKFISVINKPDQYFNEKTLVNNKCIVGATGLDFGATLGELTAVEITQALDKVGYATRSNNITSNFGYRTDPHGKKKGNQFHGGTDYSGPRGAPIYAIAAGTITRTKTGCVAGDMKCGAGYGNFVEIKHANGDKSIYAHLVKPEVQPGNQVTAGQLVGRMGTTGSSTGVHLHLVVTQNGKKVDPVQYIEKNIAAGASPAGQQQTT